MMLASETGENVFHICFFVLYIQQISGARQHRYPDTKIKEFETKVEELEKEYKR